jgi:hypothetical protein
MRIRFISDGERCCICFQPAVIKRQDIRVPNDNLLYCEACFVRIHQSMIPIMPSEAQGWWKKKMEKEKKGDGWIYFATPKYKRISRIRIIAQSATRICRMCYTRNAVISREYPGTVTRHRSYFEECFVTHKDFLIPIDPSEAQGWWKINKMEEEEGEHWIYFCLPNNEPTRIRISTHFSNRSCCMCRTDHTVVCREYRGAYRLCSFYCEDCFATHKDFLIPITPLEAKGWFTEWYERLWLYLFQKCRDSGTILSYTIYNIHWGMSRLSYVPTADSHAERKRLGLPV